MTEGQSAAGRGRLIALVVAGVGALALVGVALLTGGGSDGSGQGLRIERSAFPNSTDADLIVFVDDTDANVPETTGGKRSVKLECLDRSGRAVAQGTFPWPFGETDDGLTGPHVHLRAAADQADRAVRCRLAGTKPALEGRLGAATSR